jgi:hypothetical protein
MKRFNPIPNLKKVPPQFSIAIILASPIVGYLLMSRPVNADPGEWLRNTINSGYAQIQGQNQPLPVPSQPAPVGNNADISPCAAPPSYQASRPAQPAPVARTVQPTRTYWDGQGKILSSQRAIGLLNIAQGTRGRTITLRFGTPESSGNSTDYYWTPDGTIAVKYAAGDTVEWVGFQ